MIRADKDILNYILSLEKKSSKYIVLHQVKPKSKIIKQNHNTSNIYVLKSGIAKCYLTTENGNEFIQEFFGEGQLFGEVEAIHDTLSICSVESINEVQVYAINKNYFKELLTKDKNFNTLILKTLTNKIAYKAHRHSYNQFNSIHSNIKRLEKIFPELMRIISKQDIADYLGVTLRSLNRALKNQVEP
ncbi:Crp/Fnr family transcriptional regulator [Pontimicrobium aquaticum]|uniref:Crp/Fnr family transcriptional regulator n=1 Tax=Pontimicrobium aquaticum TaxID=2565367 RepID=A0A4U0F0X6_9FLAO|nr:Crp/Fnr family transcriptional regulator [Pontimicrobium aquaticum]TJY38057.1 Crp/Fnr family transcriptional regulator [Pontimicrobium aquaticum]